MIYLVTATLESATGSVLDCKNRHLRNSILNASERAPSLLQLRVACSTRSLDDWHKTAYFCTAFDCLPGFTLASLVHRSSQRSNATYKSSDTATETCQA